MIVDAFGEFSADQDIGADLDTGTPIASTNVVDLRAPGTQDRDIGAGTSLFVYFTISEAVAGTSSTVSFEVLVNATADLTTPTVVATTGLIAEASLVVDTRFALAIRPDIADFYGAGRYMLLRYTAGVADLTAGKVTAHLLLTAPDPTRAYASGFTF